METARGLRWLSQFDPEDIDTARTLLSSLDLVSTRNVRAAIEAQLTKLTDCGPLALYAVRERANGELPYFGDEGDSEHRPNAIGSGGNVGSEGHIASLIRSLARATSNVLDHPSLLEMKTNQVRRIVVIDDLLGSGNQTRSFLEFLYENRTIKSWLSLGFVEFHVIVFAASEEAVKSFRRFKPHAAIHYDRLCPTLRTYGWSNVDRISIRELCLKYRSALSRKHLYLGYKKTMILMVFEHGCPNNVPAILWSRSDRWTGIFPDQLIKRDILEEFADGRLGTFEHRLQLVNQTKLADAAQELNLSESSGSLLLYLAIVAQRILSLEYVSLRSGLSIEDCRLLRDRCVTWGFIDEGGRITESGRSELARLRERAEADAPKGNRSHQLYFPRSLRWPT